MQKLILFFPPVSLDFNASSFFCCSRPTRLFSCSHSIIIVWPPVHLVCRTLLVVSGFLVLLLWYFFSSLSIVIISTSTMVMIFAYLVSANLRITKTKKQYPLSSCAALNSYVLCTKRLQACCLDALQGRKCKVWHVVSAENDSLFDVW